MSGAMESVLVSSGLQMQTHYHRKALPEFAETLDPVSPWLIHDFGPI